MTRITAERLRAIVHYDPDTGLMTWLERPGFRGNKRLTGAQVGGVNPRGYLSAGIGGYRYFIHRLAWLYVFGEWPSGDLDHIDRDKTNNRISNLRVATATQNNTNQGIRSDNKSGFRGVSWVQSRNAWRAYIRVEGVNKFLGQFDNVEAAADAYRKAAEQYHGEFAATRP